MPNAVSCRRRRQPAAGRKDRPARPSVRGRAVGAPAHRVVRDGLGARRRRWRSLSIGTSAAFGLRYSIYGAIWRRIARTLRLPKVEPEHEYPPRFAQTLGSVALILSLVAFALGATVVGWGLALAVAGLQSLLAVTGYCLGCRLYFLRWWVPSVVTSIWTRGASRPVVDSAPIRFG